MRTLIFMAILGGVIYYWQHKKARLEKFESLQGDVRRAGSDFTMKEKERDRVMEKLDPLRRAKAEAEGKGTSLEQLQMEVTAMQDELKTATAQMDAAEEEFVKEMDAVRALAKQKMIPALKLTNGDELLDCSITKFGEGYVSISHKEGVKKVQADDLPEGWTQRYSLDYVPLKAEEDKEAIAAKVDEVTLTEAQIQSMKVADLDAQIRILETQLLALSYQVRDKSRRSDQLIRDAYKVALRRGQLGSAVAQRSRMFEEAKKHDQEGEFIRAKYRAIRAKKEALEKRRNQLKYHRS